MIQNIIYCVLMIYILSIGAGLILIGNPFKGPQALTKIGFFFSPLFFPFIFVEVLKGGEGFWKSLSMVLIVILMLLGTSLIFSGIFLDLGVIGISMVVFIIWYALVKAYEAL